MDPTVIADRQKLRSLELKAYRCVVDALRAQGALTRDKKEILKDLAAALHVGEKRYRSEIRRAVNDETLTSIARTVTGWETEYAWRTESMRKVPLIPLVAPETMYTSLADTVSDIVSRCNQQLSNTLTPPPSREKIQKAYIQANMERLAEEKLLHPIIKEIKFEEAALLDELDKMKYCNTFSHPDEYLSMIDDSQKFDDIVGESLLPREPIVVSLPSSKAFSVSTESTKIERKEVVPVVPETKSADSLNLEITNVKNTTSALPKSVPTVPLRSKKREVKSLPRIENQEDLQESTRMVRKAKLNAKRWNPKTQTLESPPKMEVNNVSNDLVERNIERNIVNVKRSPTRKRVEKVGIRQLATNADGDAVERTVCSTQRGRQTARWLWGRQNRIEKKVQRTKKSQIFESGTRAREDDDSLQGLSEDLRRITDKFLTNAKKVDKPTSAIIVKKKRKRTSNTDMRESSNNPRNTIPNSSSEKFRRMPEEIFTNSEKADEQTALMNPKKKLKRPLKANINASSNSVVDAVLIRGNLNTSSKKSNPLSEEEWLSSFNSIPTSRPINILRKRVCSGGTKVNSSGKKICSSSLSGETTKEELVHSFQPDAFTEKPNTSSSSKLEDLASTLAGNGLKKDLDINSATFLELSEKDSLEPVKRLEKRTTWIIEELHGNSFEVTSKAETYVSPDKSSQSILSFSAPEEGTTLDSTPKTVASQMEIKQPAAELNQCIEKSSTEFSKEKIIDDSLKSNRPIGNSVLEFLEENINYNLANESSNSTVCSEATISNEETAKSNGPVCRSTSCHWDFTIKSKEFLSNSSMNTREEEITPVKSLHEGYESNLPNSAKRLTYEDGTKTHGGVKILRPGCSKDISELLGSSVRVRTVRVRGKGIRKIPPRNFRNPAASTLMNLNEPLTEKNLAKTVNSIEHLSEVTSANPLNILMSEEVLSGSDDDVPYVRDSQINDDCMIVSEDREQEKDLVNDSHEKSTRLCDLTNDCDESQSPTIEKSVQEMIVDTISEINEDSGETDCILINAFRDEKSNHHPENLEENNVESVTIQPCLEPTSVLPNPKVISSLSDDEIVTTLVPKGELIDSLSNDEMVSTLVSRGKLIDLN